MQMYGGDVANVCQECYLSVNGNGNSWKSHCCSFFVKFVLQNGIRPLRTLQELHKMLVLVAFCLENNIYDNRCFLETSSLRTFLLNIYAEKSFCSSIFIQNGP